MQASQVIFENDLDLLLNIISQKYEVAFEEIRVGEHRLQILQLVDLEKYIDRLVEEPGSKIELPFWAKIWPASILLSYYLTSLTPEPDRKKVIELGCGIGLAGLFAASRGFNVILSDYNLDALIFSKINILKNSLQDRAAVLQVDFTRNRLNQKFDYIIGSEIFCPESGNRSLVKFLLNHLNNKSSSEVFLAADYKRKARKFFQAANNEFHITQKNIGYKEKDDLQDQKERFLCAIYRMKAKKA